MKKKKKSDSSQTTTNLSFEDALAKLETIVQHLEDGRTGLDDALKRYEEGIKYLKHCHRMLQQAERKVALLTGVDEQGNPLAEPFDQQPMSLEEKADQRSHRRRRRQTGSSRPAVGDQAEPELKAEPTEDDDMDLNGALF